MFFLFRAYRTPSAEAGVAAGKAQPVPLPHHLMPYALLLGQLRYTLDKLHTLPTAQYGTEAQKLLRDQLSATITQLDDFYSPLRATFAKRHQRLRSLKMLQHEFMAFTPGSTVPAAMWRTLHQTLITTIEASFTDIPRV